MKIQVEVFCIVTPCNDVEAARSYKMLVSYHNTTYVTTQKTSIWTGVNLVIMEKLSHILLEQGSQSHWWEEDIWP
jgi:hypothetical protein